MLIHVRFLSKWFGPNEVNGHADDIKAVSQEQAARMVEAGAGVIVPAPARKPLTVEERLAALEG